MNVVSAFRIAVPLWVGLSGCGSLDPDELAPIDGYPAWARTDVTGEVAGHGESYRIIYANDVAQGYAHAGRYPTGSILVKEVRELRDDGTPGDLKYTAVMRKVGEEAAASLDAPVDGGWVFTQKRGDSERWLDLCWSSCHVQAPVDGAFYDYGL